MYKVITHTIKEEHFEHPVLAEKGMAIHTQSNTKPHYGNTHPVMSPAGGIRRSNAGVVAPCPPTDGNIVVKMPSNGDWEGTEYWGEYQCWGDLNVYGSATVSSDLIVEGTITGTGSTADIKMLDVAPTVNTWPGKIGELCRTSNFMFVCVAPDTWIRWAIQESW